jgi:hypothetical protein
MTGIQAKLRKFAAPAFSHLGLVTPASITLARVKCNSELGNYLLSEDS